MSGFQAGHSWGAGAPCEEAQGRMGGFPGPPSSLGAARAGMVTGFQTPRPGRLRFWEAGGASPSWEGPEEPELSPGTELGPSLRPGREEVNREVMIAQICWILPGPGAVTVGCLC